MISKGIFKAIDDRLAFCDAAFANLASSLLSLILRLALIRLLKLYFLLILKFTTTKIRIILLMSIF